MAKQIVKTIENPELSQVAITALLQLRDYFGSNFSERIKTDLHDAMFYISQGDQHDTDVKNCTAALQVLYVFFSGNDLQHLAQSVDKHYDKQLMKIV